MTKIIVALLIISTSAFASVKDCQLIKQVQAPEELTTHRNSHMYEVKDGRYLELYSRRGVLLLDLQTLEFRELLPPRAGCYLNRVEGNELMFVWSCYAIGQEHNSDLVELDWKSGKAETLFNIKKKLFAVYTAGLVVASSPLHEAYGAQGVIIKRGSSKSFAVKPVRPGDDCAFGETNFVIQNDKLIYDYEGTGCGKSNNPGYGIPLADIWSATGPVTLKKMKFPGFPVVTTIAQGSFEHATNEFFGQHLVHTKDGIRSALRLNWEDPYKGTKIYELANGKLLTFQRPNFGDDLVVSLCKIH